MKILEHLWYGNITPTDRSIAPNSEIAKLLSTTVRSEQELSSLLSEPAKEVLEKLTNNQSNLTALMECEAFITGFKLGARIMLEVMDGRNLSFIDD